MTKNILRERFKMIKSWKALGNHFESKLKIYLGKYKLLQKPKTVNSNIIFTKKYELMFKFRFL